jgi:glyoxylase-like metal-dependent hydrolase (beta-lactamase superfamily II)
MATEVAPGIHRLGNDIVNYYLVEEGEGLTLVDAGLPAFRAQLEAFLRERRRTLADVDAVVLTHGHLDHVGIAETMRQQGAPVYLHANDIAMARDGEEQKTEANIFRYLRYGATWRLLGLSVRSGSARRPKIAEITPLEAGQELDVPGHPHVVHTPGHSSGHVVLHLPDRGVLFAGDAVCTWNPLTGRPGPQLMPRAFAGSTAQARESLSLLEGLEAGSVLPGHGDPWTEGVGTLVTRVREAPAS